MKVLLPIHTYFREHLLIQAGMASVTSRTGVSEAVEPLVYDDVYENVRDFEGKLLPWLWSLNLLGYFCIDCGCCQKGKLGLRKDTSRGDGCLWRCSNKSCGYKINLRYGSWFEGSKLSLPTIVKLTYYWVYKTRQDTVKRELKISSPNTLVDWFNFAREV